MPTGSMLLRQGVRVVQGTPNHPLLAPTLFLKIWKYAPPGRASRTMAALSFGRPSGGSYLFKDLIPEMELSPTAAIDKAVAIAQRGGVEEIYVNADIARLLASGSLKHPA
jgi:hypothetical protein